MKEENVLFGLVMEEYTWHEIVNPQIDQRADSYECVVCLWQHAMCGLMLLWNSEASFALYVIARHRRQDLGHVPLTSCQRAVNGVTKMQPTLHESW